MLRDIEAFEDRWRRTHPGRTSSDGVPTFVRFIESKLGATFVYDREKIPYGKTELVDLFDLARKMRDVGVLLNCEPASDFADEPFFFYWSATFPGGSENTAAGCDLKNERQALTAALAETLERYVWHERMDYFLDPMEKSLFEMHTRAHVDPRSFAGFSPAYREEKGMMHSTPESVFLWIRGTSILHGAPVWVPAQSISGHKNVGSTSQGREPLLRVRSTNGLATHATREQAIVHGALELIERDAYMITWLNQISAPHYDLTTLGGRSDRLATLLALCDRYRLKPHVLRLPTDAPAHVALGVLEDLSDVPPRFAVGLKASHSPVEAAYGALLEAMRARRGARAQLAQFPEKILQPHDVGHRDRLLYWARPENSSRLSFLTASKAVAKTDEPWEGDSAAAHLSRIATWCKERTYDFISVPLTSSYKGLVPWQTEMVVIPQLQPLHFSEKVPQTSGDRLREIPLQYGYTPRSEPFTAEPHPFS